MVANSQWLSSVFNIIMSCQQKGSKNMGHNPCLADDSMLWTLDHLKEEVKKHDLDIKEVKQSSHFPDYRKWLNNFAFLSES